MVDFFYALNVVLFQQFSNIIHILCSRFSFYILYYNHLPTVITDEVIFQFNCLTANAKIFFIFYIHINAYLYKKTLLLFTILIIWEIKIAFICDYLINLNLEYSNLCKGANGECWKTNKKLISNPNQKPNPTVGWA